MLLVSHALAAAPGVTLREGETVAQGCLDDDFCAGVWGPQLSETMIEAGYALAHDPVVTSAFGARGTGVVAEVQVDSVPLGERNLLQSLYPAIPAVPRLAVGGQLGGSSLSKPQPQAALGLHGMPSIRLGGATTWAVGASGSVAVPLHPMLWVAGEGVWTASGVRVTLIPDVRTIEDIEVLDPYFKHRGAPECSEPCLDRMNQHAASARAGLTFEPHPAFFTYLRGGFVVLAQTLAIAIDGSRWGWTPVMPELSTGLGARAGDRWQVSLGAAFATKPEAAATEKRGMAKVLLSTGFRFGPVRTRS